MGNLTDPMNKIVYEMYQYLDLDGSGTQAECVNSTIGAERVAATTTWLRENNKLGILGEFAGGTTLFVNKQCRGCLTLRLLVLMSGWVRCGGEGTILGRLYLQHGAAEWEWVSGVYRYASKFCAGAVGKSQPAKVDASDKGNSTCSGNYTMATPTASSVSVQVTGGGVSQVVGRWKIVAVVGLSFAMAPNAMLL